MSNADFPEATKHVYPNGVQVQFGGTRRGVQGYFLERWEQTPITLARGNKPCVLHFNPQTFVDGWSGRSDFNLINATSSMHSGHYLWLPAQCPQNEEDIRSWGGVEKAAVLFDLTLKLMKDCNQNSVRWINYTGRSRGLGRACRYFTHVVNADNDETRKTGAIDLVIESRLPLMIPYWQASTRAVAESGNVRAVLEPMSCAVEFFIIPTDSNPTRAEDLANVVNKIASLVAEPFRSTVEHRLTPNYHINLNFVNGNLQWGFINFDCHPEGVEQRQEIVTGAAVIDHPWSPEETMQFTGL